MVEWIAQAFQMVNKVIQFYGNFFLSSMQCLSIASSCISITTNTIIECKSHNVLKMFFSIGLDQKTARNKTQEEKTTIEMRIRSNDIEQKEKTSADRIYPSGVNFSCVVRNCVYIWWEEVIAIADNKLVGKKKVLACVCMICARRGNNSK